MKNLPSGQVWNRVPRLWPSRHLPVCVFQNGKGTPPGAVQIRVANLKATYLGKPPFPKHLLEPVVVGCVQGVPFM